MILFFCNVAKVVLSFLTYEMSLASLSGPFLETTFLNESPRGYSKFKYRFFSVIISPMDFNMFYSFNKFIKFIKFHSKLNEFIKTSFYSSK